MGPSIEQRQARYPAFRATTLVGFDPNMPRNLALGEAWRPKPFGSSCHVPTPLQALWHMLAHCILPPKLSGSQQPAPRAAHTVPWSRRGREHGLFCAQRQIPGLKNTALSCDNTGLLQFPFQLSLLICRTSWWFHLVSCHAGFTNPSGLPLCFSCDEADAVMRNLLQEHCELVASGKRF